MEWCYGQLFQYEYQGSDKSLLAHLRPFFREIADEEGCSPIFASLLYG